MRWSVTAHQLPQPLSSSNEEEGEGEGRRSQGANLVLFRLRHVSHLASPIHLNSPCLASLRPSLPSLTVNLQITCKIQIGPALSTRRRIRGTLLPVPDVSRLSIFLKIDAKITRKESKENLSRWRIKHDYASLVTIVSTASGVSVAATPARAKWKVFVSLDARLNRCYDRFVIIIIIRYVWLN